MPNMWKCYHCKKEIAPRVPTCPHCGGTFGASARGYMSGESGNAGCAIPAAILGVGILGAATFIGVTVVEAAEVQLTQIKAEELIKAHTGKWGRCLDIPVEDVYGSPNTSRLVFKEVVQNVCNKKDFTPLFHICLITKNRFQSDVSELIQRNIVRSSGRDNRNTVFIMDNNISEKGYYASNGGALCGQFPDTTISSQITRIEQTTDIRWEVTFTFEQTSNDSYFQRKLFKNRVNDRKAVEYRNGEFIVLDQ